MRSRETAGQKRSLMKYCLFAWGIPALVVGTSATLDATGALYIGYGEEKHAMSLAEYVFAGDKLHAWH